jgi:(2Fe-2S) ferredoxin
MSQYEKHVFVCTYGPYCWFDGDTDTLFSRLKRRVADAGLRDTIRINRSGCLNHCGHGPVIVVYPEGVWYGTVQPDDIDEIFEQHLCRNLPVERLRLTLPPGNNKQTTDYPPQVHGIKRVEKELDDQRQAARQAVLLEVRESGGPDEATGESAPDN